MITPELKEFLETEGYQFITEIDGRGVCGVYKFLFTVGVVCGIDNQGYKGRYCFGSEVTAVYAINKWDGTGDPPGPWIKYKGRGGERFNEMKTNNTL
jgi:hypothetical protein